MNTSAKVFYLGIVALTPLFHSPNTAHADTFYVTSWFNNTIEKFDSNGSASVFASTGLNKPLGIALDKGGNVYVANSGNGTIEKFDPNGNGTVFATAQGFGFGVGFGTNGNLSVADTQFNAVAQLNSSGQPVLGSFQTVSGATGLAFDSSGNLYVADSVHNTVVKIDPSGNSSVFAITGINQPGGLACDSSGNVYVANGNDTIERFDSNGNGALFFVPPTPAVGLAFGSTGILYAALGTGNAIEEIDPNGNSLGFLGGRSTFNNPSFIAIQVPEPTTCSLLALGIAALLGLHRLRRRCS